MESKVYNFEDMPALPENHIENIRNAFKDYLFFEKVSDGIKKYTCSACGAEFQRGRKVELRTYDSNDIALDAAHGGEYLTCPVCKKEKLQVKNANRCDFCKLTEMKCVLYFIPVNENEVWFRGCMYEHNFSECNLSPKITFNEVCRYLFEPGVALFWKKYWYSEEFNAESIIQEPFLWNHAVYCEKYDYLIFPVSEKTLDDTFLKYCSFEEFCNSGEWHNPPLLKYLALYAQYPETEMLVKTGNSKLVGYMLYGNTYYTRLLDWNAKTPWGILRLTHEEYNEYVKHGRDFKLLKIYKRMKLSGVKDFEKAKYVQKFFQGYFGDLKKIISVNAMAKRDGKTVYDAVKYFEKISRNSMGGCHQCPGITSREAYSLWEDYIDMQKAVTPDMKNIPIFPHDLKKRHDALLDNKKRSEAKNRRAEKKKYIKSLVEAAKENFPKVDDVCVSIQNKYEYENSEYKMMVPKNLEEIIKESVALNMCIHRAVTGRYYERIQQRETYLFFLRRKDKSKKPFYIIEAEPDGTIRQKRTKNDSQIEKEINAFLPFLREWQSHIQNQLDSKDKKLAAKSQELRKANLQELRENKTTINFGENRGELLVDVLEKDLLEVLAV